MSEFLAPPIRVGIVSFGFSARTFHAPFLKDNPKYNVTHVFERSHSHSLEIFPSVVIVRTLAELLASPVELVVITSPSNLHYEHAFECIEAGKHVVVEKPFAVTSEEGQTLCRKAQEKNVVLTVFHNRRWDADFLTIKKIIQENFLGNTIVHFLLSSIVQQL